MQDLTLFNTDTASVQLFNCNLGQIRVIAENGEPLFCLADLVYSLELTNPAMVKDSINTEFDKGGKFNLYPLQTKGGMQNFTFINESELYFVLMRSRSTKAKPFRQWLTKEVLPSIRKTGSYNVAQSQPKIPQTYAEALLEAGRLALENEKLIAQAKENEPKVTAYNKLMDSSDLLDFMAFSKIIGIGRNTLFKKLKEKGVLMPNNMPYQRYIDRGYFKVVEYTFEKGGNMSIYAKTLITSKGQIWITNII